MKVAIALKNCHNQWQMTNSNNKEVNRIRIKAPTAKNKYDTDNCVEEKNDDKNDECIMKEKHLERIANFQKDKTKASNGLDEEKQKMVAKFRLESQKQNKKISVMITKTFRSF